jgi:uncharacterized protein YceK
MKSFAIFAVLLFVSGCSSTMTFNSDTAEAIPPRAQSASRLTSHHAECENIGTLTFESRHAVADSDIAAIADKVASVGGTHYVVRNRMTTSHSGRARPASPVVDVLVCSSATARAYGTRRM